MAPTDDRSHNRWWRRHVSRQSREATPTASNSESPSSSRSPSTLPGRHGPSAPRTASPLEPLTVALHPSQHPNSEIDLWATALESLDRDDRQLIEQMRTGRPVQSSLAATIEDLVDLTKSKQTECEAKFWRIRIGGSWVVLRDYVAKVIEALDVVKSIGDIAVQYDPSGYAKLPWEIIGFTLEAAGIEGEQMSMLLQNMERVSRIVSRCKAYELLYRPATVPLLCLENLQQALVGQYASVLQLMGHTYKQLTRNTLVRAIASRINFKKNEELLDSISDQETQVSLEATVCESRRSVASDARLWNSVRDLHGILLRIEGPLLQVDSGVRAILRHMRKQERIEILEWVSKIPYNKHHNEFVQSRTPGTCEWLVDHQTFSQWEDSPSSILLNLRGSPGTGKTFLTSRVIDKVRGGLQGGTQDEAFAFFYCNRIDAARSDALSVLRSLVRQLSTTADDMDHLHPRLQHLYPTTRGNASDLSVAICRELIIEFVNLYPQTTIVLDALDECDMSSRRQILDILTEVLGSSKIVKIFISSRPDVDIRERLASRPSVEIQAKDNGNDIAKFSSEEISKHPTWAQMQADLKEDIIQTLLTKSDGMFQWAALQIQQLLKLRTEKAIRDRLGQLPSDLKAAYDEIYSKVEGLHPHERRLIDNAFKWVMSSCKPLTSDELLPAIAQNPEKDEIVSLGDVDERFVLEMSSNLLVLDSQRQIWRFAHLSVAEYFESNYWSQQETHRTIASVCLIWLINTHEGEIPISEIEEEMRDSSDTVDKETNDNAPKSITRFKINAFTLPDLESETDSDVGSEDLEVGRVKRRWKKTPPPLDERNFAHPLQVYIRHHWMFHVKAQEAERFVSDERLRTLLKEFLGTPFRSSWAYRHWYMDVARACGGANEGGTSRQESEIPPTSFFKIKRNLFDFDLKPRSHASLAMGLFGFYYTLLDWWDDPTIFDRVNDNGESLLAIAARMGYMEICKHIIRAGVPVDQLLGGSYGNALAAAASSGQLEVVNELIDGGANVNLPLTSTYGSALAAAAYWGKSESVRRLLLKGADVNMSLEGKPFGNALSAAVYMGHSDAALVLIDNGANVNNAVQSAKEAPEAVHRRKMLKILADAGATGIGAYDMK